MLFIPTLFFLQFSLYIVNMILSFKHKVMLFFCATAFCWAQDLNKPVNDVDVFRPEKRETKVQMVDSSQSNSIQLNVDIFADGFVGSYYILWDNVDLSEDIKKTIQSRNFAKDEFFMQNIDREQFEQERMLQLFEDRKQEFFKIFPDEALKELQERKADE